MEKESYPKGHYAARLLQHLDEALLEAGCSFEGIVVGSAAVMLTATPEAGQNNKGVGFMEESPAGQPLVELLFPPLPDYLRRAARQVAEAEKLEPQWLSQGPPAVNTLFSSGLDVPLELPQGWRARISPLVFRGDALHLHAPGRLDLIALEVAEAQRGEARPEVISRLEPNDEEIDRVKVWLAELQA